MSAERLIHILAILRQDTNADQALTLHQIQDKLLRHHPETRCSEQMIRRDLALLEGLSEEGALSVRVESSAGPHNQRYYKAYHPDFGLNEARMVFDSISISRFLSPRQKKSLRKSPLKRRRKRRNLSVPRRKNLRKRFSLLLRR